MVYNTPSGRYSKLYEDMADQIHLLVAGEAGSGKSVVINGILTCLLYRFPTDTPNGAQFILIDPKRVELIAYRNVPHTIRYASEPDSMIAAIKHAMSITENRYRVMQRNRQKKYVGSDVYVVIDEFADLMTTQRKTVMPLIQRLAQIGRAARVHIILATQTPISKVLPTEIKCNFDSRVGLRTRSAQDSRNIIGMSGLETLPRYGKGYYMTPEEEHFWNIPMVEDSEIDRLVSFWEAQRGFGFARTPKYAAASGETMWWL